MMIRFALSLVTASVVFVSGAAAQQDRSAADSGRSSTPPEVEVLAGAVDAISRLHMQEFNDSSLWDAAIEGMIDALDDPYAEVFTPVEASEWEEETTGNYSGIGLQITLLNDEVTVTAVFRGFPASQMGLQVGDVIVGVDGRDASRFTLTAPLVAGPFELAGAGDGTP